MKTVGAARFKAECLALMDEVNAKGTHILITKKGKPVAKLVPLNEDTQEDHPLGFLFIGGGKILGDLLEPVLSEQDFEAAR